MNNLAQLYDVKGLGHDTLHDILYSFWETEKSNNEIDLSLEADQKWESKLFELQEQIDTPKFKVELLSNPSKIFSEFELPENETIKSVLPPILNVDKAEELISIASEENKAIKALENRDNERIKKWP